MQINTVYGKTFAVVHKIYYSLENFCGASGHSHHVLYIASDSRGKLSRSAKKPRKPHKFSHSKVLLHTIQINICIICALSSSYRETLDIMIFRSHNHCKPTEVKKLTDFTLRISYNANRLRWKTFAACTIRL